MSESFCAANARGRDYGMHSPMQMPSQRRLAHSKGDEQDSPAAFNANITT